MEFNDIDWRAMMNSWSMEDIAYLRGICDAKLAERPAKLARFKGKGTAIDDFKSKPKVVRP